LWLEIDLSDCGLKSPSNMVPAGVAADLLGGSEPDLSGSGNGANPADSALDPFAFLEYLVEKALIGPVAYAEILLRPLTRRRFRTFWPSVVRMRMRNPWVLLRLRLLG
jgi:hypothetical protein